MPKNYPLSFTSTALLPRETAALAELFVATRDWAGVSKRVEADAAILGQGKASTRRRIFRELQPRLETLSHGELALLCNGGAKTRRLFAWQAVCRRYPFVGNFTREVLLPKVERFDPLILNSDNRAYYREQALRYGKLDTIAETTRAKLESQTFDMLSEAGLIKSTSERLLTPALPSLELCTRVRAQSPAYLNFWLLSVQ